MTKKPGAAAPNYPSALVETDTASESSELQSGRQDRSIVVMTRNLSAGTEYESVLHPPPYPVPELRLLNGAELTWQQVQASQFSERVELLADEIATVHPDVIGLQEVILIETHRQKSENPLQTTGDPGPHSDHLEILLGTLSARGLRYAPIAVVDDFAATMPTLPLAAGGSGLLVSITDREVLLARGDLSSNEFSVVATQAARFETRMMLLGSIPLFRGWVGADLKLRGKTVRVVSTHLEPNDEATRRQQAGELLIGPARIDIPLVLMGDFNSGPSSDGVRSRETYDCLIAEDTGLVDTWAHLHPGLGGYTYCHDSGSQLPNLASRIDLILTRGLSPSAAFLTGDQPNALTPTGLWPSDHAGVVAEFSFDNLGM